MKVIEIIDQLQKFDPESKITFSCSIEQGRSLSWSDEDVLLTISKEEEDEVHLNLYGEETGSQ